MTDHATEAERFHNQSLRLRTPGRVPKLADVLALANYHATMAVHDAIRGLTPNTAPTTTGDDLRTSQAEPGQLDGGKATEATERQYGHGGMVLSATDYHELAHRAEQAEAERDDALAMAAQSELDRVEEKDKADRAEAERDAILNELRKLASYASPASITALVYRHTPEG